MADKLLNFTFRWEWKPNLFFLLFKKNSCSKSPLYLIYSAGRVIIPIYIYILVRRQFSQSCVAANTLLQVHISPHSSALFIFMHSHYFHLVSMEVVIILGYYSWGIVCFLLQSVINLQIKFCLLNLSRPLWINQMNLAIDSVFFPVTDGNKSKPISVPKRLIKTALKMKTTSADSRNMSLQLRLMRQSRRPRRATSRRNPTATNSSLTANHRSPRLTKRLLRRGLLRSLDFLLALRPHMPSGR